MAKRELHSKAVEMRKQGASYNEIKKELGVSKGTLSLWLRNIPLSEKTIEELSSKKEKQIERCRETKSRKRNERLQNVSEIVANDLGTLSDREVLLCGLFLYWGEGSKTQIDTVSISNTDPTVILFFKKWVTLLGFPQEKLRIYLHLYNDMDVPQEITYWSSVLDLPKESFRKPYIKESKRSGITYTQRFTHGTCNLICHSRDLGEYVHMALEHMRDSSFASLSQM